MDELGGQERFAEWVRVHGVAVRGFIFARVRRPDAVEDMVQEVFCRAWAARDRYREQGASLAYLLKIADRLVCDRGRRGQPERNLDHEQWKEFGPPSGEDDPFQAAEQYGLAVRAAQHAAPNPYTFPTICSWYAGVTFEPDAQNHPEKSRYRIATTTGQVEELRYFHVTTLEELAGLTDANAKNIGPILHLREKARDQIQRAKENAPSEQLRDALVERDNKITTLERQMQEVIAANKMLQDKILAQAGVTTPSAQVEIPIPRQARR